MTLTTIDSREAAPLGSVWLTDVGTRWRVVAHVGEYVTVERVARVKGDTYHWHVSSLTVTTAKRIDTPCPACGEPHDPTYIPPPRVPLTIRCACCCQ